MSTETKATLMCALILVTLYAWVFVAATTELTM